MIKWGQLRQQSTRAGFCFKSRSTIQLIVDKGPQCDIKYRSGIAVSTARKHTADFCLSDIRRQQMNRSVKSSQDVARGKKSGYNRTNVLNINGGTTVTTMYPPQYVKDVSMEAFEAVITQLKEHKDQQIRDLAAAADACFLVWQLAGVEGAMAMQTIGEYLPVLLGVLYVEEVEEEEVFLGDLEEENIAAEVRPRALDVLEELCNWTNPNPTREEKEAREKWKLFFEKGLIVAP